MKVRSPMLITNKISIDNSIFSCLAYFVKFHGMSAQDAIDIVDVNLANMVLYESCLLQQFFEWEVAIRKNEEDERIQAEAEESKLVEILPQLYLGNYEALKNVDNLKEKEITGTINILTSHLVPSG